MNKEIDLQDIIANIGFIDIQPLLINFVEKTEKGNYSDFIKKLKEKKVIADIGSGFGSFQNYLNEIVDIQTRILCIDPVYKDINGGLIKAVDMLKIQIHHLLSTKRDKEVNFFLSNTKYYCDNWLRKNNIEYKEKLSGDEKIDIAFITELYREIPNSYSFLTDIIKNLNNSGELYILDRSDCDFVNIAFLIELANNGLITYYNDENGYIVFKIIKETFEYNIKYIEELYNKSYSNFFDYYNSSIGEILKDGTLEKNKKYLKDIVDNYTYNLTLSLEDFNNLRTEYFPYWNFPEGTAYDFRISIINKYNLIKSNFEEGSKYIEFKLLDGELVYDFIEKKDNNFELEEAINKLLKLQLQIGI